MTPIIRESVSADIAALEQLYPAAFPDEDLLPLLRDLLQAPSGVISLVASIDSELVGHCAFTLCGVEGSNVAIAMLAPLAVAPGRQRQGIGSAIVRAGLEQLKSGNVRLVCVLGDPGYYRRFGFKPDARIEPPYRLPPEWSDAWQSLALDGDVTTVKGKLTVPPLWNDPALWAP